MYKNLSPSWIGVFGRQSELVEIALTHRFKGLEIDINDVLRRAQGSSAAQACRYLCSAQVKIGGFELPIRWSGDEKEFQKELDEAGLLLEVCTKLGADRCLTSLRPTCDQRPFHENFQFHVDRLGRLADALAPANVKIGLSFTSAQADRTDGGFEFIHQVDPALLLLNSLHKDNVGIVFDAWHWWVGGGDAGRLRTLKADQIVSVRLADIPVGVELANCASDQRLMPGDGGLIDTPAILAALEDIGYDGPVAVAPNPGLFKGQTRESIVSRASAALDACLGVVSEKTAAAAS